MSLKSAFNKLGETIGDLSSLEVNTFSGEITAVIHADTGNILDWEKLIEASRDTGGEVSLQLASKFNFDGDANLFVANTEIPDEIRAAHDGAVRGGQQVRRDLMELFKDLID